MRTGIEVLTTSLLSLVISFNLLLYSLQRYSPPVPDSPSFSVLDCTSHKTDAELSSIVDLITGDEGETGTEKHCFCHGCCSQRHNTEIHKPVITAAACSDESSYPFQNESSCADDFNRNIPIRSPPGTVI